MADPFDSAWLKWGWAVREAEALKEDVQVFAGDDSAQRLNTTGCYYDPKRHGFILVVTGVPPLPPSISLRLSTVAHSYRSCLDNLAWALVSIGPTPQSGLCDDAQRAISFPLYKNRTGFNKCLVTTKKRYSRLPGLIDTRSGRAHIAIIRRCQPYFNGKRTVPYQTLVILASLNNLDKHRTLQPVLFTPEQIGLEITDSGDAEVFSIPLRAKRRPLEVGAELARFPARRTGPNPYLQVECEFFAFPCLNQSVSLEDWLYRAQQLILELLATFSDPPNEELGKLGLPPIVRAP